jgi:predicted phage terminase large subunit-like protein
VVLDVVTHVGPPHEVHALIAQTAVADGHDVTVRLPQDPGQAGKDQAQTFKRELAGFTVVTKPVTGDKVVRAGPLSSQVGANNVAVVRAPWTPAFVAQLHAFPDTKRDDKVDAASDAFSELASPAPARTATEHHYDF